MKLKPFVLLAIYFVSFQARIGVAQGSMSYLDNTGQSITGMGGFNLTPYLAAQFLTGTNSGGYTLNSLQLLFADAVESPLEVNYIRCYLLSDNNNSPLTILNGFIPNDNPTTAGLHTFIPTLPLSPLTTLDANTDYWLLFSPYGNSSAGYYRYNLTDSVNSVANEGWSVTGNVWYGQVGIPMFSINATAIPEPSTFALLFMALVIIVCKYTTALMTKISGHFPHSQDSLI